MDTPHKAELVLAEKYLNESSTDKKADNLAMLGRLLIAIRDYPQFAFSRQCCYANIAYGKALYEFLPGLEAEGYVKKNTIGRKNVVVLTEDGLEFLDQVVTSYMMFHDVLSHHAKGGAKSLFARVIVEV